MEPAFLYAPGLCLIFYRREIKRGVRCSPLRWAGSRPYCHNVHIKAARGSAGRIKRNSYNVRETLKG